ncbi:MAG: type II/IV secretion system protein [Sedimentisphaerales bacterium]|nr:type II/IV secretion system protein [Sedimentisphaerales bacterium]
MSEAFTTDQPLLIQLLLKRGLIKQEDLKNIREAKNRMNCSMEEVLAALSLATELDIAEAYSEELEIPLVEQDQPLIGNKKLAEMIGEAICSEHHFVPLSKEDNIIQVALADPTDLMLLERIELATGLVAKPVIATSSMVNNALGKIFETCDFVNEGPPEDERPPMDMEMDDDGPILDGDEEEEDEEILDLNYTPSIDADTTRGNDGQVIRLVNHILTSAIENDASDIHIEPFEKNVKVRFRIDGELHEIAPPGKAMYVPMVSRLKILAKMDIAEKRIPQDGAITLKAGDAKIDLRVNTVPTVFGEKMAIRILSKGVIPKDLTKLGFSKKQADNFKEAAESPHGLMLVTGPTGSGKTTTLYSVLNLVNKPNVNIMTVEDPVEYKFEGMNQVHVRSQVGLTFAAALRAFLRQDPDIIMVGEIRDQETAQICLRAALTGHMVFSTLHTNDALASINRLADMGVEKFLLASALRLVEAQRLVRRLCAKCKEKYQIDKDTAKRWGLNPDKPYYRTKGCEDCRGCGYSGRVGLFEVVSISPKLRDMISEGAPLSELRAIARKEKFMLLFDAGMQKVEEGLTSLEEVMHTCMEEVAEEESNVTEDVVLEEAMYSDIT